MDQIWLEGPGMMKTLSSSVLTKEKMIAEGFCPMRNINLKQINWVNI